MATWADVENYLMSQYTCEKLGDMALRMRFKIDGDRSQVIFISWSSTSPDSAGWLDFHSPVGEVGKIDLAKALDETKDYVFGGLSQVAGMVTLRNSVPMENLDQNEIDLPLHGILQIADMLEQTLTGADTY